MKCAILKHLGIVMGLNCFYTDVRMVVMLIVAVLFKYIKT